MEAESDSRPIRANAGRNISKLINQELGGDEFYSSVYGGFEEDEEDLEYEVILIKTHQVIIPLPCEWRISCCAILSHLCVYTTHILVGGLGRGRCGQ